MDNYKLADELNRKIVEGLVEGYQEYIDIRREKAQTMKVSGAYAWVKGNHIDNSIANSCESYGVESKLAKAGLTWQYLQFKNKKNNLLFIVKNAKYFSEEKVNQGIDAKGRLRKSKLTYLENLMQINTNVDFGNIAPLTTKYPTQLEFFEDIKLTEKDNEEISSVAGEFDRFYIVTYGIDENQMLSQITLFMPNPSDNKAYIIEDLTPYMDSMPIIEIEDELKSVLTSSFNEIDEDAAFSFGIKINNNPLEKSEGEN